MASAAIEILSLPPRMQSLMLDDFSSTLSRNGLLAGNDAQTSSSAPSAASGFQRSASYTFLGNARQQFPGRPHEPFSIRDSFSEDDLIAAPEDFLDQASTTSSGWTTPEERDARLYTERLAARDGLLELETNARLSTRYLAQQNADERLAAKKTASSSQQSTTSLSSADSQNKAQRSSTGTTSSNRKQRKSWTSTTTTPDSRSPSPAKRATVNASSHQQGGTLCQSSPQTLIGASNSRSRQFAGSTPPSSGHSSQVSTRNSSPAVYKTEESTTTISVQSKAPINHTSRPSASRRSSIFKRPLSGIFGKNAWNDHDTLQPVPAIPAIPKSFSTDRLPSFASNIISGNRPAPPPRLGFVDKSIANNQQATIKKKDELWTIFRNLDADYAKFASKSLALKANVVRSALIPFLQTYAKHTSIDTIRAEDLDRRAIILNKWWTGLIEMLHGRNNQSLSGTDRPAILDGIAGMMERPEWRLSPPFCPLDRRAKGLNQSRSTTSLSSVASDHLFESVHQNVRNIFVQNLKSQMAFVVDKMSLRNASASLVSFCGKACAYAFMFVPGMADVLVRLWNLQSDTLRRVLAENGVERFGHLGSKSDDLVLNFPPCVGNLSFTSLSTFVRKLHTPPPLPSGTTNIEWWGYWLERWTGRESDLFYVFVKHYHVLVADFLLPGSTMDERMCVPGMLPVHGQILTNLDATIHRQANRNPVVEPGIDDAFADPDAIASTLPIPPMNAVRNMQENRLVMLMRDFLSERVTGQPLARQLFAETFNSLLEAATQGVSLYDAAACYTLLDLLEEALVILARYEQASQAVGSIIDPVFWQTVSRRMIASENTLTEIRLYAFLYTIWHSVTCDLGRKAELCLNLLLDPAIFASRFCHWSPMVRAYYMRLICWRVARYDGDPSPGDFDILETLLERLQMTWSHYLWFRGQASEIHSLIPQTSPCNPAPHRRLRIIRIDPQVPSPGSFPAFDVILSPSSARTPRPQSKRLSMTFSSLTELQTRSPSNGSIDSPDSDSAPNSPSGIRSFLHRVSTVSQRSRSKSRSSGSKTPTFDHITTPPLPRLADSTPALLRAATAELISGRERAERSATLETKSAERNELGAPRSFSFKFAMEYNINIKAPDPLRLVPPRLPGPAQKLLSEMSELSTSPLYSHVAKPTGIARRRVAYTGRALAEWALIVGECQSFFERRRREGIPDNKQVETPMLGVEVFKRPG